MDFAGQVRIPSARDASNRAQVYERAELEAAALRSACDAALAAGVVRAGDELVKETAAVVAELTTAELRAGNRGFVVLLRAAGARS